MHESVSVLKLRFKWFISMRVQSSAEIKALREGAQFMDELHRNKG